MGTPISPYSSASPCSWSGFNSFWFVSNPNQDKYAGLVWLNLDGFVTVLINILSWFGQLVSNVIKISPANGLDRNEFYGLDFDMNYVWVGQMSCIR